MISLQGIVLSKWADTLKNMQHNEFGVHFRPVKGDEKEVWKHVILNEGEQLVSTVDSDKIGLVSLGYCFRGSDDFGYLIEDKIHNKVLVGHIEDAEYLTGKKQRREVTKMLQAINSLLTA